MHKISLARINSIEMILLKNTLLKISSFVVVNSLIIGAINPMILAQNIQSTSNNQAQSTTQTQSIDYSVLEQEILSEINRVRTSPTAYADWLEGMKQYYDGMYLKLPGETPIGTNKGLETLEEAIIFLRQLEPLNPLNLSKPLKNIAVERVQAQNTQNISRSDSESISYGKYTSQAIVMLLIVDDGVPNRINRQNILNSDFQITGIACAKNDSYNNMCVISYDKDSNYLTTQTPTTNSSENIANSPNTSIVTENNTNNNQVLLSQKGQLADGDAIIPNDGSLYDSYPLQVNAGDRVTIAAVSQDFDIILAVMDEQGKTIRQNDDINGGNKNASLDVTFPSTGIYYVIVNCYDKKERGQYTLEVTRP